MKKRIALVVAALVAVVLLTFGAVLGRTFGGLMPKSELVLKSGARPIIDMHTTAFAVPLPSTAGKQVLLIDCDMDKDAKALKAGLGAQTVAAIFITHGHPDHLGGCAMFPGVPVYALVDEVAVIDGAEGTHGPLPRMMGAQQFGVRVTHPLQDRDVVDVLGTKVGVFAVPGHTRGSAAYAVDGTLFLGDAASANADGSLRGAAWIFSDDTAQARASLHGLAKALTDTHVAVDTFAFAHSGPVPADVTKLAAVE